MTEIQATEIIEILKNLRFIGYIIEAAAVSGAASLFFIVSRGK